MSVLVDTLNYPPSPPQKKTQTIQHGGCIGCFCVQWQSDKGCLGNSNINYNNNKKFNKNSLLIIKYLYKLKKLKNSNYFFGIQATIRTSRDSVGSHMLDFMLETIWLKTGSHFNIKKSTTKRFSSYCWVRGGTVKHIL